MAGRRPADGLIEGRAAPGSRERFGHERLSSAVADLPEGADEADLASPIGDVQAAGGKPFHDDVTVLLLTRI